MSKITIMMETDNTHDAEMYIKAQDLVTALSEVRMLFRGVRKYGIPEHILTKYPQLRADNAAEIVDAFEDMYIEILKDANLLHLGY